MKVSVNKSVLESILINTQPYLEKRDLSQITSHLFISSKNNLFEVKSSDFEIGLSYYTNNINILDEGEATANGKKLLDIVKILKDDDVILETINDYLYIKQKNSKYKLPMFNPNEFPEFPTIEGKPKFEINSTQLVRAIKKVAPAIDSNNPKFELNGALIDIKSDDINIIATDTKRLALSHIKKSSEKELKLIIPKKAITEMQKLFFDDIEIYYDEVMLIAKSSNFLFFTKLINGKYPEYERIIPKERKYDIILNRDRMIDAIKKISIISNEMKITFKPDVIVFESLNEDNIEAKTEVEFSTKIDDEIYLATHSRSLLDFLGQIESNTFTLGYNDSAVPFILESNEFLTVVMPIMI